MTHGGTAPPPKRLPEVRQVGPFTLSAHIGAGRRTNVFLGHHEDHPARPLVIRELLHHIDPDLFEAEHRSAGGIRVGEPFEPLYRTERSAVAHGRVVIGENLATILDHVFTSKQPLNIDLAIAIAMGISSRLAQLKKGLFHGDLVPHHVIVGYDGQVHLIDPANDAYRERVKDHRRAGYRSPEHISEKGVSVVSDIFVLGILLFELTTATRLFDGSVSDIDGRILRGQTPRARDVVGDGYPIELQLVLRKLMRPAIGGRFADLEVAHDALRLVATAREQVTANDLGRWLRQTFESRHLVWKDVVQSREPERSPRERARTTRSAPIQIPTTPPKTEEPPILSKVRQHIEELQEESRHLGVYEDTDDQASSIESLRDTTQPLQFPLQENETFEELPDESLVAKAKSAKTPEHEAITRQIPLEPDTDQGVFSTAPFRAIPGAPTEVMERKETVRVEPELARTQPGDIEPGAQTDPEVPMRPRLSRGASDLRLPTPPPLIDQDDDGGETLKPDFETNKRDTVRPGGLEDQIGEELTDTLPKDLEDRIAEELAETSLEEEEEEQHPVALGAPMVPAAPTTEPLSPKTQPEMPPLPISSLSDLPTEQQIDAPPALSADLVLGAKPKQAIETELTLDDRPQETKDRVETQQSAPPKELDLASDLLDAGFTAEGLDLEPTAEEESLSDTIDEASAFDVLPANVVAEVQSATILTDDTGIPTNRPLDEDFIPSPPIPGPRKVQPRPESEALAKDAPLAAEALQPNAESKLGEPVAPALLQASDLIETQDDSRAGGKDQGPPAQIKEPLDRAATVPTKEIGLQPSDVESDGSPLLPPEDLLLDPSESAIPTEVVRERIVANAPQGVEMPALASADLPPINPEEEDNKTPQARVPTLVVRDRVVPVEEPVLSSVNDPIEVEETSAGGMVIPVADEELEQTEPRSRFLVFFLLFVLFVAAAAAVVINRSALNLTIPFLDPPGNFGGEDLVPPQVGSSTVTTTTVTTPLEVLEGSPDAGVEPIAEPEKPEKPERPAGDAGRVDAGTVDVGVHKPVRREPPKKVRARRKSTQVVVKSAPRWATIRVDGLKVPQGAVVTIKNRPVKIEAEAKGYESKEISVRPGRTKPVLLWLKKKSAPFPKEKEPEAEEDEDLYDEDEDEIDEDSL